MPGAIPEEGSWIGGRYVLSVCVVAGIILGHNPEITSALHINTPAGVLAVVPVLTGDEYRIARLVGVIAPERDAEVRIAIVGDRSELQFRRIVQCHVVVDGIGSIDRQRDTFSDPASLGGRRA